MRLVRNWANLTLLMVGSLLFLLVSVIGAAVPLTRALRVYSRLEYWVAVSLVLLALAGNGLIFLAGVFFSIAFLLFIYFEMERLNTNLTLPAATALMTTSGLVGFGFYFWTLSLGDKWKITVLDMIELWMKPLQQLNPQFQVEAIDILVQTPSMVFILLGATLWIGILSDRIGKPTEADDLLNFSLPEFLVWFVPIALLAAFFNHGIEWLRVVGVNAMNILVFAYFLQGLAVVGSAFSYYKVSPLWRFIVYVFVVVNLFLLVSLLGLVDIWLNIRHRLRSKLLPKSEER